MHERSLVKSLLQQVEQIVKENSAIEVAEVVVNIVIEIGPLSGVEIELVRIAFNELAGDTTLTIIEVPLTIHCLKCEQSSELTDFVFRCKICDSGQVKVISGDEFRLLSVTLLEEPTHAQ